MGPVAVTGDELVLPGTPAGTGIGLTPPKYLKAGDRVAMVIGGIGTLENPVAEI